MDERARRAYRGFAIFFLITGAVFLALGLVRLWIAPDVLRGDPLPVAAFLVAVGGALLWTVRDREG